LDEWDAMVVFTGNVIWRAHTPGAEIMYPRMLTKGSHLTCIRYVHHIPRVVDIDVNTLPEWIKLTFDKYDWMLVDPMSRRYIGDFPVVEIPIVSELYVTKGGHDADTS
jgi:hypothetical protein